MHGPSAHFSKSFIKTFYLQILLLFVVFIVVRNSLTYSKFDTFFVVKNVSH